MSHARSHARVRSRIVATSAVAGVLAAGLVATMPADATAAGSTDPAVTTYESGRYIVLMDAVPTAAYRGGLSGYPATAPSGNRTFDSDTRDARRYAERLRSRQDAVADAVGAEPFYHYTASFNGFAAELTGRQASALSRAPGVTAVVQDQVREPDTVNSPDFLGLTGPLGLWRRLGGSNSSTGAGEGVVVGVVDTGINSDSPSFASTGTPTPDSFTGVFD